MKRHKFFTRLLVTILVLFGIEALAVTIVTAQERHAQKALQEEIQTVIDHRLALQTTAEDVDLFDDGTVSVLILGLDTRAGSDMAHCDVIQFIELDAKNDFVNITAVPRGTFSLLPGSNHLPTDYYISNACGIGGLEYGITQIEKILGKSPDHVIMVGFSKAIGIFRLLNLPTTETLQWLRARQPYAIGEPQRAHNHSTFLKQLLTQHTFTETSRKQTAWEYILYRLVDTDLSFFQAQQLVTELTNMELPTHPERVQLFMRPEYMVQDLPYNPETLDAFLESPFNPADGASKEEVQQKVIDTINTRLHDPVLVTRLFEQQFWLQLDDASVRESAHFALLEAYLASITNKEEQQAILADYVIEMEALEELTWAEKGRALLRE